MRRRLLAACALVAAVAGAAQAQSAQTTPTPWRSSGVPASYERLEISGFVGGASVSGFLPGRNIYMSVDTFPRDVSFGDLWGVRASWAFTEVLAVEGNVSRSENRYAMDVFDFVLGGFDLGDQFDARHTAATGNVVVHIPAPWGLVPYATGGAGYVRTTVVQGPIGDSDASSTFEFNFGGGVKYFFTTPRWLGLRFDVRYRKAGEGLPFAGGTSSPSGTELTLGAVVRLF